MMVLCMVADPSLRNDGMTNNGNNLNADRRRHCADGRGQRRNCIHDWGKDVSSPQTNDSLMHGDLTGAIVRVFYRVYDHLGFGFLESVYCAAMAHEFAAEGIRFVRESPIDVVYKGSRVGHFKADFLVEGCVAIEVKASELLSTAHRRQLLNCLSASKLEVGLLLHFGPKARFERMVHSASRKRA